MKIPRVRSSSIAAADLLALALSLASAPVRAQERDGAAEPSNSRRDEDAWSFRVTPYLWFLNFSASGQVKNRPFNGTANFSEIVDNLGGGILIVGIARQGDWSINLNVDHLRVADDFRGPLNGNVDIRYDIVVPDLTVGYRFANFDFGRTSDRGSPPRLGLEALAGVRYYYNDIKVNPTRTGSASESLDWLDLVAGVRGIFDVTERLRIAARADLGGFNIGGSDMGVQALVLAEFDITKNISLDLGYRYLSAGYEQSGVAGTELRLRAKGMLAGVTFRF